MNPFPSLTTPAIFTIGGKFKSFKGFMLSMYLILFGMFRFIVEYFRVPDDQLGYLLLNLTMGQLISFIFFITGLSMYYLKNDIKKES